MPSVSVPILLAAEFPTTMIPLRTRIEESGYVLLDGAHLPGGLSPAIALVPFNIQLDLAKLEALVARVRAEHPSTTVIGVNFGRMQFKVNEAYGAGLRLIYALPFEEELLMNKLFELAPPAVDGKELTLDMLMRVNVLEIERAPSLPYDLYLYLPANRKVIHYYTRASVIDEKRVRKFKENAHYSLYLRRTDLNLYKRHCAELVTSGSADRMIVAEGEGRRRSAERLMGLMGGFFSDEALGEEESQMTLDTLKSVVDTLETPGTSREVVAEVVKLASQQMTQASHAQNVAAYCCLFGLALEASDPTTLKLGGLLHDIGRADFPLHLLGRELNEMEATDAAMYKLHPGNGRMTIENRKLRVPPGVIDMVLYHHERPDGSGYPYGKTSGEIPLVAKICAFADEFDKLTSVRPNKRQLSPVEAVRRIAGLDGGPPMSVFEDAVHHPLVDLLLQPKSKAVPEGPAAPASGPAATASTPSPAGRGLRLKALLEASKLVARHTAHLTRETPKYGELWAEFEEHWTKRKLRPAR